MATPQARGRRRGPQWPGRTPCRPSRGRALPLVLAPLLALALLVGSPLPPGHAVLHGLPAASPSAQVRVFEDGSPIGGGTLVDRSWVLTAAHLFLEADLPSFSVRFGVVDSRDDSADDANLRSIDRIELHPSLADVALVHLSAPVPEGTWIPSLATAAPPRYGVGRQYGWAPDMRRLGRELGIVIDPVATENAEFLRDNPIFAADFPPTVDPVVIRVGAVWGDSGSGSFNQAGELFGIQSIKANYQYVNESGDFLEPSFIAAYQQPVWRYLDWIQGVISGEGTSNPMPPEEELQPRRRLTEDPAGDLPMSMPPQIDVCDPGETACAKPDPAWALGNLTGAGNYRGTALAVCAQAAENTCSFNGTGYAGGAIARLSLGPSNAPGTAPRQVMVWCKTSAVFAEGAQAQPALRVSFTNGDGAKVPVGYGWWDVTTDQVGTGSGQTPVDTGSLATC